MWHSVHHLHEAEEACCWGVCLNHVTVINLQCLLRNKAGIFYVVEGVSFQLEKLAVQDVTIFGACCVGVNEIWAAEQLA